MSNKDKGKYEEFQALREEILQWQSSRITIVTGSIAFFGAVLSWLASSERTYDWQIPSILLLALIGCAAFLCFYCGRGNAKIGAYIEVYLEGPESGLGWETRLRKVGKESELNLNKVFGLIFLVLAVLSILVPPYLTKVEQIGLSSGKSVILIIDVILTLLSIINLIFRSYPRQKYVDAWKELKRREK